MALCSYIYLKEQVLFHVPQLQMASTSEMKSGDTVRSDSIGSDSL